MSNEYSAYSKNGSAFSFAPAQQGTSSSDIRLSSIVSSACDKFFISRGMPTGADMGFIYQYRLNKAKQEAEKNENSKN